MIKGLSHNLDCDLIGFVRYGISSGAITIFEAQEWVYYMIENNDDLPPYMYYLMDAKGLNEFERIIGFSAHPKLTEDECKALNGLFSVRFPSEEWCANISKKAALNALKRNPQVVDRFKETFPFIELPENILTSA